MTVPAKFQKNRSCFCKTGALRLRCICGSCGNRKCHLSCVTPFCTIKARWPHDYLAKGSTHSFWSGKYRDVQEEFLAHGVSQSGTLKLMLDRLRSHCKEVHPIATRHSNLDSAPSATSSNQNSYLYSNSSVNLCQKLINLILSKTDQVLL